MRKLLKNDFLRIFKSGGFRAILIVGLILGALSPVALYGIIMLILTYMPDAAGSFDMRTAINSINMFSSSLSIASTNFFSVILVIILIVQISRDFTQGTIRNKIIQGYSRTKIYFSTLIVIFTTILLSLFMYGIVRFGVSLIFFNPLPEGDVVDHILYIVETFGFQLLYILFISSFISLFVFINKRALMPLLFFIIGIMLIRSIGSITDFTKRSVEYGSFPYYLLRYLTILNPFYMYEYLGPNGSLLGLLGNLITSVGDYTIAKSIELGVPLLLYISINISFGLLAANKSDIK